MAVDAPPLPEHWSSESSGDLRDDWAFCWNRLLEVSRTFSRPIEMLSEELRVATTCGYLLCRIADTVEDHPTLAPRRRDTLYRAFLGVLEDGEPSDRFTNRFSEVPGDGPEYELSERLDRVMSVFRRLPDEVARDCVQWVGEMTRGMQLYGHRPQNDDGLAVLMNMSDLERYCYYVAGTVGHMLTDLFIHDIDGLSADRHRQLKTTAERFGLGLQMVNILKDQTDDLERSWCFIPASLAAREGLEPMELFEPAHRERAHRAVEPIFDRAADHLDAAFDYTLAIPPGESDIRLFCLLPLWMAVRTLVYARGNDAMFREGEPVKIERSEVESLIADCVERVGDDDALRDRYAELWE
ncbi:MAG: phytoene/squalene synthase family protein [Bradymonadaceae bacterium]